MVSRSPDDVPVPGVNGKNHDMPSASGGKRARTVRIPVLLDVTMQDTEDELQAEVAAIGAVEGLQIDTTPGMGFTVKIAGVIAARVMDP